MGDKVTCPCCGYKTLNEQGAYEICEVCGWEDDSINVAKPTYKDGPNWPVSLIEAQQNFIKRGGATQEEKEMFEKDPNWKPF